MTSSAESVKDFERNGFTTLRSVVTPSQIEDLAAAIEKTRGETNAPGFRGLLTRCPAVKTFADGSPMREIAMTLLGNSPLPVRAILFDKTPESNWYVTWHQDLTIPVQEKSDIDGFESWSTKEGVPHCQPPARILEHMVSLRLHLDDCDESNGPIKFIAGSHRSGILPTEAIAKYREEKAHVVGVAKRGDVIAMRPLILHSSSVASSADRRRVLHVEYAGISLPAPLAWAQA